MPEIIVYTNEQSCANSVAEINPFTVGDATDDWTIRFNNGTDFYSVSNVTMSVGHINGLPAGTYNSAFKWTDRADNVSIANIGISSSGVPTLQFQSGTDPLGGVIGTNGVYILRGPELDGSVSRATLVESGQYLQVITGVTTLDFDVPKTHLPSNGVGTDLAIIRLTLSTGGATSPEVQTYTTTSSNEHLWYKGTVTGASIIRAGSNYLEDTVTIGPSATRKQISVIPYTVAGGNTNYEVIFENGLNAIIDITVNTAKNEFPFMRDESGNNIIAATTLSPYSDGEIEGSTQFNHSTLVVRPETVANASSLSASTDATGPKWTATMDPINAYVTERLALRNSTQLDLQIRGDGRTLFQGQLTVLNKIA